MEELYLFGTDSPDLWVNTGDYFERKIEAISRHAIQVTDADKIRRDIGNWNRQLGEEKGFTYAEAFKVLCPHCEICR